VIELDEPDLGLWTFHQPLSVLGAQIGCRMTVLRLANGELLIHSPIAITSGLQRRLDDLGAVRHVLAPNADHYLFVEGYAKAYSGARLYAAPGVTRKLPRVRFDVELAYPGVVPEWTGTVDQAYFRSSGELQELVLFHRIGRTLITADLAFNVQASGGVLSRVMLRLNDSYRSFGPSRVCRRHITRPDLARTDVDRILGWSPDRVVVSHGEILMSGAEESLRRAYGWLR
jgi:hypothetical protein